MSNEITDTQRIDFLANPDQFIVSIMAAVALIEPDYSIRDIIDKAIMQHNNKQRSSDGN